MKETLPKSGWFFMNKIVRSANQPRNSPKSASNHCLGRKGDGLICAIFQFSTRLNHADQAVHLSLNPPNPQGKLCNAQGGTAGQTKSTPKKATPARSNAPGGESACPPRSTDTREAINFP
jgi:hypothetical protein